MKKLVISFVTASVAFSMFGCASVGSKETQAFDKAVQMVKDAGIPTRAKTWNELLDDSSVLVKACLKVAISDLDDGVSTASDIAKVIVPICPDYFAISEYVLFKGEKILVDTSQTRYQIALDRVLKERAASRDK